ncbi:MAG: glutamate-cysteine ligase family protein [Phycisphaerales bacterium]
MDPIAEMRLWPHEANPIYEAFDKIFNCKGHGWANLQSTHINLPFSNEEEFGRLHAAIRMVLPLIPALAASSPILDGRWSPIADQRLEVYRRNSVRIPEAAGLVIPEPVFSRADYEKMIFQPLYTALRPHDPEGILQHEWANSRGCIARFMRGSIEIRVVDIQECPAADLAVVALITAAVKAMYDERWISYEEQKSYDVKTLHEVLLDTIRYAERTRIMSAPSSARSDGPVRPAGPATCGCVSSTSCWPMTPSSRRR